MKIADLPFRERPLLELLHLDVDRDDVDTEYAGYGWARAERIWLASRSELVPVDDALVLGLHSADDGEALADDVELEFELPGGKPVSVLLSKFLRQWLPKLPGAPAIVLAMCNPHRAEVRAGAPVRYADGDVESWLERRDDGDRIQLVADFWYTVTP
ncbi:MAG TPA: hypothetical protein VFQ53_22955 [Kofleriaceae bacterium]|nr:hypothetical protein [Kofleriaceae bacterium]